MIQKKGKSSEFDAEDDDQIKSNQISLEGLIKKWLYSYLKNRFWVQKVQFWQFLKKLPAANFFVN